MIPAMVALHLGLASTVWVLTVATTVSVSLIGRGQPEHNDQPAWRLDGDPALVTMTL